MTWFYLALIGALGQALTLAIKKKSLENKGLNNEIGMITFLVGGLVLSLALAFSPDGFQYSIHDTSQFCKGMSAVVFFNVLGALFLYKALDISDLSFITPFMTMTALFSLLPAFLFLDETPSVTTIVGIIVLIIGAIVMERVGRTSVVTHSLRTQLNRKALMYFAVVLLCYTMSPIVFKISVKESSVLFTSILSQILIGVSFAVLVVLKRYRDPVRVRIPAQFFLPLICAGIILAIEIWATNQALTDRKSTRLNSSHPRLSRMPSSA